MPCYMGLYYVMLDDGQLMVTLPLGEMRGEPLYRLSDRVPHVESIARPLFSPAYEVDRLIRRDRWEYLTAQDVKERYHEDVLKDFTWP